MSQTSAMRRNAPVDKTPDDNDVQRNGPTLKSQRVSSMYDNQFIAHSGDWNGFDLEHPARLSANILEEGTNAIQSDVIALNLWQVGIEIVPDNILSEQISGGRQIAEVQPFHQLNIRMISVHVMPAIL
jgi:hypothetical protein